MAQQESNEKIPYKSSDDVKFYGYRFPLRLLQFFFFLEVSNQVTKLKKGKRREALKIKKEDGIKKKKKKAFLFPKINQSCPWSGSKEEIQ